MKSVSKRGDAIRQGWRQFGWTGRRVWGLDARCKQGPEGGGPQELLPGTHGHSKGEMACGIHIIVRRDEEGSLP